MIELPEAVTLAAQMDAALSGLVIDQGDRGTVAHKFVFTNRPDEEYGPLLQGKRVSGVHALNKWVFVDLEPGCQLQLGDLGGRLRYHADGSNLPPKRHLTLRFDDGACFTVSIQGWGFIRLVAPGEDPTPPWGMTGLSPLRDEFTAERFAEAVAAYPEPRQSVKKLLVSGPCVLGIGNGYLQDMLFHAGLHPKHPVEALRPDEIDALWRAIRRVLAEAIKAGGRDTERDLHGQPGGYRPVLDQRAAGQPCPQCGTTIEKLSYLGGSCYVCPSCQT